MGCNGDRYGCPELAIMNGQSFTCMRLNHVTSSPSIGAADFEAVHAMGDPSNTDEKGETVLHKVCANLRGNDNRRNSKASKHKECVDILVQDNPQFLNQSDDIGRTALFHCFTGGIKGNLTWDLATHLLERGADVSVVDNGQQNVTHYLLNEVQLQQQLQHPRTLFETQALLRLLVNSCSELLHQRDLQGNTPFMLVCLGGNLDLIFFFLKEHGAIRDLLRR